MSSYVGEFLICSSLIIAFLLVRHLIGRHSARFLKLLKKKQMLLFEHNVRELSTYQEDERTGKIVRKTGKRSPRPFPYFNRVRQAQTNPNYSGGLTWLFDGFQDVVREKHGRVCGR